MYLENVCSQCSNRENSRGRCSLAPADHSHSGLPLSMDRPKWLIDLIDKSELDNIANPRSESRTGMGLVRAAGGGEGLAQANGVRTYCG
jgi:hypothetical protein